MLPYSSVVACAAAYGLKALHSVGNGGVGSVREAEVSGMFVSSMFLCTPSEFGRVSCFLERLGVEVCS